MKKVIFFVSIASMAVILTSCGNKKQPQAQVTQGGVFANEVPVDTVQAEPLTGEAYTIEIPSGWKSADAGMMGNSCVLHLRKAPYTVANITTAPKLNSDVYMALRDKEGCKRRPALEVYGRQFIVYDRTDADANIILSAATPLGGCLFILTLKAGPQRLPMEETHSAMYDNMKTLLENVVFR